MKNEYYYYEDGQVKVSQTPISVTITINKKKYKWFFWSPFNECWMDNGEGVSNWIKQGFTVRRFRM
jgi:hypothetical protein